MSALLPKVFPHGRKWTKDEFYRLGEAGFFRGQRVELIEGELLVMSPQNALHANMIDAIAEVLRLLFGPGWRVRCQLPLDLGLITEPEPDLCIVRGARLTFLHGHPRSASLVVEVSDTTLAYDRGDKASLYAAGGIDDYWVVNLVDNVLEVFRSPVADATAPHGSRYSSHFVLAAPATVVALAVPGVALPVADLLP